MTKCMLFVIATLLGCSSPTFVVLEDIEDGIDSAITRETATTDSQTRADGGGDDGLPPSVDVADASETLGGDSRLEGGADAPLEGSSDAAGSDSHDATDAKDSAVDTTPCEVGPFDPPC